MCQKGNFMLEHRRPPVATSGTADTVGLWMPTKEQVPSQAIFTNSQSTNAETKGHWTPLMK